MVAEELKGRVNKQSCVGKAAGIEIGKEEREQDGGQGGEEDEERDGEEDGKDDEMW